MVKVSLNTLWKVAVLILLGLIAFYGYRIDNNTASPKYIYYYSPSPIYSCGGVAKSTSTALPNICVTPDQQSVTK